MWIVFCFFGEKTRNAKKFCVTIHLFCKNHLKLCAKCGDRLDIYSGNDDLILPTLSLGGAGVISVLSNILPKEVGDICQLWFEGKSDEARALQLRLLPLINAIFSEVNPIPIKALLSKEGFCAEEYRLPLCQMTEDKKNVLFKTWAEFKTWFCLTRLKKGEDKSAPFYFKRIKSISTPILSGASLAGNTKSPI